jgi:hypothetical protein
MSIRLEKLPNEPIIYGDMGVNFNFREDIENYLTTVFQLLDQQPEPVFYIVDLIGNHMSLDDVMVALQKSTKQMDILHHPNVREFVIVATSPMLKLSAKGLNSSVFGRVKTAVVDTMQDALDYCRAQG